MSACNPTRSTHFNDKGGARIVDITAKDVTVREAVASSSIRMNTAAVQAIGHGDSRKGDVLAVARLAAIAAAKWTSTLIPLCHAIPIEAVEVDFQWVQNKLEREGLPQRGAAPPRVGESPPDAQSLDGPCSTLKCLVTVRTTFKTGVEMEAMTAASVATLTVYDMLKSVDRAMVITTTQLESKKGGKSGDFSRTESAPELHEHEN